MSHCMECGTSSDEILYDQEHHVNSSIWQGVEMKDLTVWQLSRLFPPFHLMLLDHVAKCMGIWPLRTYRHYIQYGQSIDFFFSAEVAQWNKLILFLFWGVDCYSWGCPYATCPPYSWNSSCRGGDPRKILLVDIMAWSCTIYGGSWSCMGLEGASHLLFWGRETHFVVLLMRWQWVSTPEDTSCTCLGQFFYPPSARMLFMRDMLLS